MAGCVGQMRMKEEEAPALPLCSVVVDGTKQPPPTVSTQRPHCTLLLPSECILDSFRHVPPTLYTSHTASNSELQGQGLGISSRLPPLVDCLLPFLDTILRPCPTTPFLHFEANSNSRTSGRSGAPLSVHTPTRRSEEETWTCLGRARLGRSMNATLDQFVELLRGPVELSSIPRPNGPPHVGANHSRRPPIHPLNLHCSGRLPTSLLSLNVRRVVSSFSSLLFRSSRRAER